jgi:4-hydroxy-tetrahydrodipicolinate synthase
VADGKVSRPAMEKLVDYVISNRNNGLVVLGGTGEYNALTGEQRVDAIKITIEANKGRVPVVAGISGPGLPEAIEMGIACKNLGVDAIMVVTPYYVVANQDGIFDFYANVIEKVDLPLILYNIPYRTGVNMLPETVERLVEKDRNGRIVAMKECCTNMSQVLDLLYRLKDRISILTGEEFLFFQEVSCGAEGAILATSNLVPDIWADLFDFIKEGDLKRSSEIILKLTPLLKLIFSESNPGPLKEAMKFIGIDCGDPLLPLKKPQQKTIDAIEDELKKLLKWYRK